jgi:hypothetical protein
VEQRRPAVAIGGVLAIVALALAAGLALGLGGPRRPAPDEPRAYLPVAADKLRAASTVHLSAEVDGTLALPTGTTSRDQSSAAVALAGTRLAGDIDLTNDAMDVTFEIPAMLGLTGRLVEIGNAAYLSTTLQGAGWLALDEPVDVPVAGKGPAAIIERLAGWLERGSLIAGRLPDVLCGGDTCFRATFKLPVKEALFDQSASAAGGATPDQVMTLTTRVARSTLRLAGLDVRVGSGERKLDIQLGLESWDAPVAIAPPPSEQVTPGTLDDLLR